MKVGTFVSITQPDDPWPLLLQVLELPRRLNLVQTYDYIEQQNTLWNLQRYEVWRGGIAPIESPETLEAHAIEDPERIDLMRLIGFTFVSRDRCRTWTPTLSYVCGLLAFHKPQRLNPNVPLGSSVVPILSCIAELEVQGFTGVHRTVEHRREVKVFDERHPSRLYLQALLCAAWLFDNGCEYFLSGRNQSYYRLLMKEPGAALHGMSTEQCDNRLRGLKKVTIRIPLLEVATTEQPVVVRECAGGIDGDGSGDDEGGIPGQPEGEEDLAPPPRDPTPEVEGDDGGDAAFCYPVQVFGATILNEDRPTPSGYSFGFRMVCPHHGLPCRRFRSRHLRVEHEGRLAPIYFLGAWVKGGETRTADEHSTWTPSVSDIHTFMASPDAP